MAIECASHERFLRQMQCDLPTLTKLTPRLRFPTVRLGLKLCRGSKARMQRFEPTYSLPRPGTSPMI